MTTLLYGRPPVVFDPPGDAIQTSPLIPDSAALEAQDPGSADSVTIYAPPGVLERRYVLALALKALKVGGRLRFVTDWKAYADWALARFLETPGLHWMAGAADDWRTAPADHIRTRYEDKRLGDTEPVFLLFERRAADAA